MEYPQEFPDEGEDFPTEEELLKHKGGIEECTGTQENGCIVERTPETMPIMALCEAHN